MRIECSPPRNLLFNCQRIQIKKKKPIKMYQYFRFTVFHFEMWNKLSLFTQREILQNITMANTNNNKWFDTILWSSWCWDFKFILVFNKYLHICRKVQIVFIWVIDRAPEIYVGVCSHDRQNKSDNLILIGFMKKKTCIHFSCNFEY